MPPPPPHRPPSDKPGVIDLFCGAGGFSLSACLAGFSPVCSIDWDEDLTSSYSMNFPGTEPVLADLSTDAESVIEEANGEALSAVGVVGGPPCQGFSVMGPRNAKDPRNTLFKSFFSVVAAVRPAFFVAENVPNLLTPRYSEVLSRALEEVPRGYVTLAPFVLNAADYGAATNRRRVFVVGYDPDRVDGLSREVFDEHKRAPALVGDAILDLPEPVEVEAGDYGWLGYLDGRPDGLSEYAETARRPAPKGLGSARARAVVGRSVSGLQATRHTSRVAERMRDQEPGKKDPTSRARRLRLDESSPTIRAGTGKKAGRFMTTRHVHPTRPRVITVREAARLQGFPDWFLFHSTKWHSFRMIGNSVSPYVGSAVLKTVYSRLR